MFLDNRKMTGSNNGIRWADAFTDLQEALAVAQDSHGGVEEI